MSAPAEKTAEWNDRGEKRKLVVLPVEDNARLIYGALGAYRGEVLGTPCDGAF